MAPWEHGHGSYGSCPDRSIGAQVCGTAGGLMGHMGHAAQSAAVTQAGGEARGRGRPQWVIGVIWAVGIKSLAAYAIRYTDSDYVT